MLLMTEFHKALYVKQIHIPYNDVISTKHKEKSLLVETDFFPSNRDTSFEMTAPIISHRLIMPKEFWVTPANDRRTQQSNRCSSRLTIGISQAGALIT